MKKIILTIFAILLGIVSPALASDFPTDPQGVKVLDRNYYVGQKPWLYALLYDKGSDRVLELFKASEAADGSTTWQSAFSTVYRKGMNQKFLDGFPFEVIHIGENKDKSLRISVVGMLETEPGITISYDMKTGAFHQEEMED